MGRDGRCLARTAQYRPPADRGIHAGGKRSGGGVSGERRHRSHLSHSREARPEARDGVRGGGGALRRIVGNRRDSGETVRLFGQAARGIEESARDRAGERRDSDHAAALSEAGGEDRRQAGGAHSELSDAAQSAAGEIQRGESGTLRTGGEDVHPLHVADSAVSGSGGAPAAARTVDWQGGDAANGARSGGGGVLAIGAA